MSTLLRVCPFLVGNLQNSEDSDKTNDYLDTDFMEKCRI